MDPEIAKQLRRRGLDVLSAKEVSLLEVSDDVQLRYAAARGRVICTKDSDFAKPANWTVEHDGIAFFPDGNASIGYIVAALLEVSRSENPENMKNSLRYL
jgi:predicted nuclease of predicted toxin-antitoxin system